MRLGDMWDVGGEITELVWWCLDPPDKLIALTFNAADYSTPHGLG
jgi:hypothetical protein